MSTFYKTEDGYLYLNIKAVPGASKTCLGEISGDNLKVRISAAPEDGKANNKLISFLSKILKIPKQDIEIISGEKARLKKIKLPVTTKKFFDNYIISGIF